MTRLPRIYHDGSIYLKEDLLLGALPSRHLLQVLKLKIDAPILLFGPEGGDFFCHLKAIHQKQALVFVSQHQPRDLRSPLEVEVGQSLARGEKMDFMIQKSVELGVSHISPLITQFTNVRLEDKRKAQRLKHWQQIAIAAAEQCGQTTVPTIHPITSLKDWIFAKNTPGFICDPSATTALSDIACTQKKIRLLIGPEGGFSTEELLFAKTQAFEAVSLGPRVLRTETAALCALSILQARYGDI